MVGAYGDNEHGAFAGAVFVYNITESGEWYLMQKLTPKEPHANDMFGEKLQVQDGHMVINARFHGHDQEHSGAAYYSIISCQYFLLICNVSRKQFF